MRELSFTAPHSRDQDLKVGNLLTLEGGFAYNVPKGGGAFGLGYYLQNTFTIARPGM